MEKEIHSLEAEATAAARAQKVLEDAIAEKLEERREALGAEQPRKLEALRKVQAAERRDLEARRKALDARRMGEQGAALRQVRHDAAIGRRRSSL